MKYPKIGTILKVKNPAFFQKDIRYEVIKRQEQVDPQYIVVKVINSTHPYVYYMTEESYKKYLEEALKP